MLIALVSIATLVILNLLACRAIRGSNEATFAQNIMIAVVWAVPVLGLFVVCVLTKKTHAEPP